MLGVIMTYRVAPFFTDTSVRVEPVTPEEIEEMAAGLARQYMKDCGPWLDLGVGG